MTEKGFSAVGIEETLPAAPIPNGFFYDYFDSKNDFGLALINVYADYFARSPASSTAGRAGSATLAADRGFH